MPGSNRNRSATTVTETFRGYLQFLQANSGSPLWLPRTLPSDSFHFIQQESTSHSTSRRPSAPTAQPCLCAVTKIQTGRLQPFGHGGGAHQEQKMSVAHIIHNTYNSYLCIIDDNILRAKTNALWYVTNHTLHTDVNIPYVNLYIWLAVHHSITFLLLPTRYTNFLFIHTNYINP